MAFKDLATMERRSEALLSYAQKTCCAHLKSRSTESDWRISPVTSNKLSMHEEATVLRFQNVPLQSSLQQVAVQPRSLPSSHPQKFRSSDNSWLKNSPRKVARSQCRKNMSLSVPEWRVLAAYLVKLQNESPSKFARL